jgi:hypothetical protein
MLDLDVTAQEGAVDLVLDNHGGAPAFTFDPEIPLGASVVSAQCGGRPVKAEPELHDEDEHARIEFKAPAGVTKCSIAYRGGVAVIPPLTAPVVGQSSRGVKITSIRLQGEALTIDADVNAAGPQSVDIRTPWKPTSADGGKVSAEGVNLFRVDFDSPATAPQSGYSHRSVTIHFNAE